MIINVTPTPKPRMTQRDKWLNPPRPAVVRYHAFADELRLRTNHLDNFPAAVFDVVFYLPMPASWSKKKRAKMDGCAHQQKPDRDNLLKAFQDALCSDDAHIYDGRVAKYWTSGPGHIVYTESE